MAGAPTLHVEYAERIKVNGILFMFSPFCEYVHLEYVRIHVVYRVNQAEYVIHILMVAPQEYVNLYSTPRAPTRTCRKKIVTADASNTRSGRPTRTRKERAAQG